MASTCHLSKEPAIQRVPVEVWSRILALAISCPLLPSDDDSLIANLYLLQYDCELIAAYWTSERLRLSCRLVCQSWRSLLDRYANRLFLPADPTSALPFCQRIQLEPNVIQWVPCHRHRARGHPDCPVRKWFHPHNLMEGRSNPYNVQAFVDHINSSTRTWVDFASKFPRLQVLCLRGFETLWDHPVSLPTLSANCTSLTHLAIYLFFQMVEGESQILVLPNLHTLFLHLITGNLNEIRAVPLGKWRLPKLRNLGVRANLLNDGKGTYEEFQLLMKNFGNNLRGLSFAWRPGPYEESLSSLIWGWCPQLQFLEISLFSISALWPPPDTHTQLVIVIMDLKEQVSEKDLVPYANLLADIAPLRNGKTYNFGMPISWSALRPNLERAISLSQRLGPRPFVQLFECFQNRGFTFIDRYGVSILSEEAQEIMKWVREEYDSGQPNFDSFNGL